MSLQQQLSTIFGHDITIDIKRVITLKSIAIKVQGKVITIKVPFFLESISISLIVVSWAKAKQEKNRNKTVIVRLFFI